MEQTVILGLGNTLMGDDGAGVQALRRLRGRHFRSSTPRLIDGGTLSFSLAAPLADAARLVVVDAAELGCPPGACRIFRGDEMDRFLGSGRRKSVHEVSLLDLLDMARLSDCLPRRRALVGIQPGYIGWRDGLTTEVERALDAVCAEVVALIEEWAHEPAA